MKMMPEQKAFFEFGAAKAFLFNKIEEARDYARRVYGESYSELTPKERADCWKHRSLKFFVKRVREKRAACRSWTIPSHERHCGNCTHGGTRPYETPCRECSRSIFALSYEMVSDNWEPREFPDFRKAADDAGENTDRNPHNSLENDPAHVRETLADGKEGR